MVGENGRNPVKNLPRPRFIHHETHMEGPKHELGTPAVGGEHLTACATRPPIIQYYRTQLKTVSTSKYRFRIFIKVLLYASKFVVSERYVFEQIVIYEKLFFH